MAALPAPETQGVAGFHHRMAARAALLRIERATLRLLLDDRHALRQPVAPPDTG